MTRLGSPLHWGTAQYIALDASDMPCDPNLVSSAFYAIPISLSTFLFTYLLSFFGNYSCHRPNPNTLLPTIIMYCYASEVKGLMKQVFFLGASSLFHCMCFNQHLYRCMYMYTYISLGSRPSPFMCVMWAFNLRGKETRRTWKAWVE